MAVCLVQAGGALRRVSRSTRVEQVRAHLGSASLLGVGGSPVKVALRRVVPHPQYDPRLLDFDLALLELVRPLAFNPHVQPVCLPLAIHDFPVGRKCVISGWGNTQEGNGEARAARRVRSCNLVGGGGTTGVSSGSPGSQQAGRAPARVGGHRGPEDVQRTL